MLGTLGERVIEAQFISRVFFFEDLEDENEAVYGNNSSVA